MSREAALEALIAAITRETGLVPRGDWHELARRALTRVAEERRTTMETLLEDRPGLRALFPMLIAELTVGETYFYRHPGHFDLLAEALSSRLRSDPHAHAHVLSIGCASGEEAYSAAIAVHAKLGPDALARVRIHAIDINAGSIEKARAGVYGPWALRDAPSWLLSRYFVPGEASGHRVADDLRRAVTFHHAHFPGHTAALHDGTVDAIFFRNVGIYLAPPVVNDAYREFSRLLRPEGLLFVAPADPRPEGDDFINTTHETTSVYERRAAWGKRGPASCRKTPPSPRASRPRTPPRSSRKVALPNPRAASEPRHAAPPETRRSAARAMALAESGDERAALASVDPADPVAFYIRGQIALSHGRAEEAVDELRRALYLSPDHKLARHLYVLALRACGRARQSLVQARALEKLLSQSERGVLLEDERTTAGELLEAVRFVLEGLE